MQNGCSPIRVGAIRGSRYVRPEKLKRSPFLSDVRIPDVNIRVEVAAVGYKLAAAGCKMAAAGRKMAAAGRKIYPDMWSGRPPMVYPDALSGYTCMDSKELSSISDCFGDQKGIKTPKLNTI